MPAIGEHVQNVIQYPVEVPRDILGEEAQDEITVFLQELVFMAVAAIGNRVAEVLRAIDLDREARPIADQINLHATRSIKWDRQARVQAKAPRGHG